MDMTGERRIPAPRQKVWDALNDPEVLRLCIPGCESLEKTSDTDLKATAAVKIGPIATRFTGKVQLTDLDPPNSYRISGEGQGGVAGFAKGGANVRLSDDGGGTLLQYDVKAQVGGKIAQLGARLIDATSKQMADMFFDRFTTEVAGPVTPTEPVAGTADPLAPVLAPQPAVEAARAREPQALSIFSMIPEQPFGFPRIAFVGAALYLIIFIMIFKSYVFG